MWVEVNIMADESHVEVLYDGKALVGEGPFYDEQTGELIYVDITAKLVNFLNVETRQQRSVTLPAKVSAAVPVEGSRDQLVVTVGKKICIMNRQTGTLEDLVEVDQGRPMRFNDAKCDALGRLWAGTMHDDPDHTAKGSLYMLNNKGAVTEKLSDVSLSNGMAWNRDQNIMYYVDSTLRKVYTFNYSPESGEISNRTVCIDYCEDEGRLGHPDGMTIDTYVAATANWRCQKS